MPEIENVCLNLRKWNKREKGRECNKREKIGNAAEVKKEWESALKVEKQMLSAHTTCWNQFAQILSSAFWQFQSF